MRIGKCSVNVQRTLSLIKCILSRFPRSHPSPLPNASSIANLNQIYRLFSSSVAGFWVVDIGDVPSDPATPLSLLPSLLDEVNRAPPLSLRRM